MTTHAAEHARVYTLVAPLILGFRRQTRKPFHVDELRAHVRAQIPTVAPDSPGRILRALRQGGMLNYRVINRRQSLYEFV